MYDILGISDVNMCISILQEFKLDPEHWTITSLRRGQWQKFDGEWLESMRVNVVPTSIFVIKILKSS
jgi:hypothetical protein